MADERSPSASPWPPGDAELARMAARLCPGAGEQACQRALRRCEQARRARVRLLRRAIRSGVYHVPAGFVAAAMLIEARSFSQLPLPAGKIHYKH